jgi:FlgD Ig-like domain
LRRAATTVLVLAVLAGAAAAFAVSEALKVQVAAVTDTHISKVFSPVCNCEKQRARIEFRLTRSERLTLDVVDSEGDRVRRLVDGGRFARGRHHFTWDGRNDDGMLVPEGRYRPRVRLEEAGRTLVLPNPIRVDVTRPRIALVSVRRVFSPDGDDRADVLRVHYRVSEPAYGLLYVNGRRRVRGRLQRLQDELAWYGRVGGRVLPAGAYRLTLVAVDRAGNRSRPMPAGFVRIRFVQLPGRVLRGSAGERLVVSVSTDAKRLRYVLRRGSSVVAAGSSGRTLRLRLPDQPGRYLLVVQGAGHRAQATVVVRTR